MAEDTSKVVIIALVTLIILAGGFLLFQKFTSKSVRQSANQNQIIQDEVSKEPNITKDVKDVTPSAKVLPKTGTPFGLLVIFASSALISGWGLSKFPK